MVFRNAWWKRCTRVPPRSPPPGRQLHNPLITADVEEGRKQARNLRKGVGALASVESGCK